MALALGAARTRNRAKDTARAILNGLQVILSAMSNRIDQYFNHYGTEQHANDQNYYIGHVA
jgi:hypothetical protein